MKCIELFIPSNNREMVESLVPVRNPGVCPRDSGTVVSKTDMLLLVHAQNTVVHIACMMHLAIYYVIHFSVVIRFFHYYYSSFLLLVDLCIFLHLRCTFDVSRHIIADIVFNVVLRDQSAIMTPPFNCIVADICFHAAVYWIATSSDWSSHVVADICFNIGVSALVQSGCSV